MEGIIYKFTNTINNKSYIGQTINEKRRESEFFATNQYYCNKKSKIDNARKKYGLSREIWKKEVLKRIVCEDREEMFNELNKWEKFYISIYDTYKNGYNSTDGGQNNFSADYGNKCKVWEGKHMYDYMCDSIRKKKRGIPLTDEIKDKIKKTTKNNVKNGLYCKSIYKCDKNNHNLIIKEYPSISSISEDGFKPNNVLNCLKGRSESYKGYFWRYKENNITETIIKGCSYIKKRNRWRSRVKYQRKDYILGYFMTKEEAIFMYRYAKDVIDKGDNFIKWFENIEIHKHYVRENYNKNNI